MHKPCLIVVVLRLAECSILQMVAEVERRFSEGVPLLDPAKDMGIKDSDFRKAIRYLLQHASWGCGCQSAATKLQVGHNHKPMLHVCGSAVSAEKVLVPHRNVVPVLGLGFWLSQAACR